MNSKANTVAVPESLRSSPLAEVWAEKEVVGQKTSILHPAYKTYIVCRCSPPPS